MTRKEELLETVRRSFDGDAWHGPALQDALADVTARQAAARPSPDVHSIWEITLHAAGWAREVASRLGGRAPQEPDAGDWPAQGSTDEEWADAVRQLVTARDVLLAAIGSLSEADLDRMIGTNPEPALATGFSFAGSLEGLAQHNAYHAGQISLLKKMM